MEAAAPRAHPPSPRGCTRCRVSPRIRQATRLCWAQAEQCAGTSTGVCPSPELCWVTGREQESQARLPWAGKPEQLCSMEEASSGEAWRVTAKHEAESKGQISAKLLLSLPWDPTQLH